MLYSFTIYSYIVKYKYIIPYLMEDVNMADREVTAIISKQSAIEIQKAINEIDGTGVTIKGLEIIETNDGVSVLKILLEV